MKSLMQLFDLFKVNYEQISDKEIKIECPADVVPRKKYKKVSQIETIQDKDTTCYTDSAYISILKDDDNELSWLIILPE